MRAILSAAAVAAVLFSAPVLAQNMLVQNGAANRAATSRQAPVGHRQPKAGDVPPQTTEAVDQQAERERDARLDRMLHICSGC